MATDGPERSGSAEGFPVPSITIWVRSAADVGAGVAVAVWARLVAASNGRRSSVKNASRNERILGSPFIRLLRLEEEGQDLFVFLDPRQQVIRLYPAAH